MFIDPPPRKVVLYVKTFDTGYRLPTTDFMDELLQKNDINIYELTPNVVTKIVAFEMLCRSLELLPDLWVFRNYFRFSTTND